MKTFDCGCTINDKIGDLYEIPLGCPVVFRTICDGDTTMAFQLESQLLKQWSRRLKPQSIDDISALIALVRPGVLEAKDSRGISMAEVFCRRKHGEEQASYIHPSLEPILKKTFGVIIFQEQAMKICVDLAGFNLQEADSLRKAMGRKLPEEMAKVRELFLEKAKGFGVIPDEIAIEIFDQIEKSQRYSFNEAHSVAYAYNAYYSVWTKKHLILPAFTSWLDHASDHAEIKDLHESAKLNSVQLEIPDITDLKPSFYIKNNSIRFGLTNIKGVGESVFLKLQNVVKEAESKLQKKIADFTWLDFLIYISPQINSSSVTALISSGALSPFKKSRTRMLTEFKKFLLLTDREIRAIQNNPTQWTTVSEAINDLSLNQCGITVSAPRSQKLKDIIKILDSPLSNQQDNPNWLCNIEEQLLGTSISITRADICDTEQATSTCKEFLEGKSGVQALAVEILDLREVETKRGKSEGKKMAFLKAADSSCSLDNITCFAEQYEKFGDLLWVGNTVLLVGKKDKKRGCLIVENCQQI